MSSPSGSRHEAIGIKQTIRLEWMQQAANLLLAGLDAKAIRQALHASLADKKGNGAAGERSDQTRTFVVNNLMRIWVAPGRELISFRDAQLAFLRENTAMALAVHWGMISAVYPFWFNVARQTGRLLALQDQVTQTQIINRLKEQYGDRQTVSRYGRFVIRALVAWGVLKDSPGRGCYERVQALLIDDQRLAVLMIEAGLYAAPGGNSMLNVLLNNPGFFPFRLPGVTGDVVAQLSDRVGVARYGLDEEMLFLENPSLTSADRPISEHV